MTMAPRRRRVVRRSIALLEALLPPLLLLLVLPTTAALGTGFDVREATIDSLHDALFGRAVTCREVVSAFLARIEEYNPRINAVVSLNPTALADADRLDARLAAGNATGPLFCVPVLLKDNFDAVGMPTTAGCRALAGNVPSEDAPTVRALRDAGAVVLGKTNLHEMALEGLTVSSLGGQTVSPYDLTRTPGGSSGGSGAAVAASLAVLATGTDTVNSLRSPASANALFSLRPTRGLVSRAGVVPVSYTQDAVGAVARSPRDLAVALTVMAAARRRDYAAAGLRPDRDGLAGLRLGVLHGFFNHTPSPETTPVNDVMARMLSQLAAAGAEIVNITDRFPSVLSVAELDVQAFEFREALDSYLAAAAGLSRPASFRELYSSSSSSSGGGGGGGGEFLVIPAQHRFIRRAASSSTADVAYLDAMHRIRNLTLELGATFAAHRLDALVYPEQQNLVVKIGSPSQRGRNGILAALTGHPVVCVPAGLSPPWTTPPSACPELVPVRKMPPFANGTVEPRVYESVPSVAPNVAGIPDVYPLGVF
ncbi:hypothetical protein VTH06DRAFT_8457 [Thermothelomyces fergusii]